MPTGKHEKHEKHEKHGCEAGGAGREPERELVVFDFDHTVLDLNSDVEVIDMLARSGDEGARVAQLALTRPPDQYWIETMNLVFLAFAHAHISPLQVLLSTFLNYGLIHFTSYTFIQLRQREFFRGGIDRLTRGGLGGWGSPVGAAPRTPEKVLKIFTEIQ